MSSLLCLGKRSKNKVPQEKKPKTDPALKKKKKKSILSSKDSASLLSEKDEVGDVTTETDSLLNSFEPPYDKLKQDMAAVENRCADLQKDNDGLKLYKEKVEELNKSLANIELEMERVRTDNIAMTDELKMKTTVLADAETLILERNKEIQELRETIATKYGTTFENSGTQTEMENELFKELELTKRQLNEIVLKLNEVEAMNNQLMKENRSISDMKTIANQVEQEVKQLIEENVRLELQKAQVIEKLVEYEKQLIATQEEKELLKQQIEIISLKEVKNEKGTKTTCNIDDRLSEAEKNQEELSHLIDEINVTVKSLELRQDTLEDPPRSSKCNNHLYQIPNRLKNAEKQHIELNDFLEQIADKCAILEKRMKTEEEKDMTSLHSIGIPKLEELEEQHRKLQIDYIQLNESMASLEVRLAVVENYNKELLGARAQDSNTCIRLENEISALKHEKETITKELCETKEDYRKVLEENEKIFEHARELEKHGISAAGKRSDTGGVTGLENSPESSEVLEAAAIANNGPKACLTDKIIGPTQIAGKFRNYLYGRLWKESMGTLTCNGVKDEKKNVQVLLELCIEAYMFCKRTARHQLECLVNILSSPCNFRNAHQSRNKTAHTQRISEGSLPATLKQQLQSFRQTPSQNLIERLSQEFFNHVEYERSRHLRSLSGRDLNHVLDFIQTCLELSWQMVVQDPPMYLQFKVRHGTALDTDRFDEYGTCGQKVDCLVWPAILKEDNGVVLQKGVVQCLTDNT